MTEPLGTATQYRDLVAIARRRMAERRLSFEQLDALSGLAKGLSAKLLSDNPHTTKKLGPISFGAVFGALGIVWIAVPDAAAVARLDRRSDHTEKKVDARGLRLQLAKPEIIELFRALGSMGAKATNRRLTATQRSANAAHAARVQWRQRKWWVPRHAAD